MAFRESDHSGRVEIRDENGHASAYYFMGMPAHCDPTTLKIVRNMAWGTAAVADAATAFTFDKQLSNIYDSVENNINKKIYNHENACVDKEGTRSAHSK